MVGRTFRRVSVVLTLASLSVWTVARAADYEAPQSRSRKPASGWATKGTEQNVSLDTLEEKLKRIVANQQTILQKADVVKQELEVIKVRISMRRSRTRSDTDVQ